MLFQKGKLFRFSIAATVWVTLSVVSIGCYSPSHQHDISNNSYTSPLMSYLNSKYTRQSVSHEYVTDGFDNTFQAHHVFSEIVPLISNKVWNNDTVPNNYNTESDICLSRPQYFSIYFIKTIHKSIDFLRSQFCSLLDHLIILIKKFGNQKTKSTYKTTPYMPRKRWYRTKYYTASALLTTMTHTVTKSIDPITKTVTATSTSVKTIKSPRLKLGKNKLSNVIVSEAKNVTIDHVIKLQFKLPHWISDILYS